MNRRHIRLTLALILLTLAACGTPGTGDRHMVQAFLRGERPIETFADGVAVMEMLMALYRSAEIGQTVYLPQVDLEAYIPPVARGDYHG